MTLSVGFLGYRFIGTAHANALARLGMFFPDAPAVDRDVLVGRDEAALSAAADRLGFDRYATDWRDVVGEVDAFYNLGPNSIHAEPSIAALEAGTHVLCEKPLAHTLADAERMADAARDSAAAAGVAFNYRFVPAVQYARRLIDDGALGEIRHVRARYLQDWLVDSAAPWSWRNAAEIAGSGALGDLGAHSLDLAQFLVGDSIARVSGHLRTFVDERPVADDTDDPPDANGGENTETRPVTVDDAYTAQVEFEGGAMGFSRPPGVRAATRTATRSRSPGRRARSGSISNASTNWTSTPAIVAGSRPYWSRTRTTRTSTGGGRPATPWGGSTRSSTRTTSSSRRWGRARHTRRTSRRGWRSSVCSTRSSAATTAASGSPYRQSTENRVRGPGRAAR